MSSLPASIRVIVAGLDMDLSPKPFGPNAFYLLAKADCVNTKLHADLAWNAAILRIAPRENA